MKLFRVLSALGFALLLTTTFYQCGGSSELTNQSSSRWSWLGANGGTYWYVPTENLQAITWNTSDPSAYTSVDDQTVWHIQSFDNGYFFGPVVAKFTGYSRNCQYLIGSVTEEGKVYISFNAVEAIQIENPAITTGNGEMVQKSGDWAFAMQMASGTSSTEVSHWAYMLQCTPNQSCWNDLPGVTQSIPEFLGLCGLQ